MANRNVEEILPEIVFEQLEEGEMIQLVSYDAAEQKFRLNEEATNVIFGA